MKKRLSKVFYKLHMYKLSKKICPDTYYRLLLAEMGEKFYKGIENMIKAINAFAESLRRAYENEEKSE